jgi:hypothetical protein
MFCLAVTVGSITDKSEDKSFFLCCCGLFWVVFFLFVKDPVIADSIKYWELANEKFF